MKLLFISLLSTIAFCFAASLKSHPASPDQVSQKTLKLWRNVQLTEGCNINVCFAIDGSLSISDQEFESQKFFTFDVTSILIDFPVSYAVVQYSKRIEQVSPLTSDILSLLLTLNGTRPLRETATNITRGIRYCSRTLRRHPEDLNSIILFTDGRANSGRDPVRIANRFREMGGKLFIVGVGSQDDEALLRIAGGDPTKVLNVNNFLDTLSATESLANTVLHTCGNVRATETEEPSFT